MKWNPWVETHTSPPPARNNGEVITEPPCKWCHHWCPQIKYACMDSGFGEDGVRLCHAREMHYDFSCYKERENNK